MRVVSEWNYKNLKVTVFHMNEKYSVKLEENLLEQTYKFRDGQIRDINHLKSIMDEAFYQNCSELFASMSSSRDNLLKVSGEDFEFEEII